MRTFAMKDKTLRHQNSVRSLGESFWIVDKLHRIGLANVEMCFYYNLYVEFGDSILPAVRYAHAHMYEQYALATNAPG